MRNAVVPSCAKKLKIAIYLQITGNNLKQTTDFILSTAISETKGFAKKHLSENCTLLYDLYDVKKCRIRYLPTKM